VQEKIKSCALAFSSLSVCSPIQLGREEGFIPKAIGEFIREEMLKSVFHIINIH